MKKMLATLMTSTIVLASLVLASTNVFAAETINAGTLGAGYDATNDSAAANSKAEFAIDPGQLRLDQVPDLHFANDNGTNPKVADFSKEVHLNLFDGKLSNASKDGNSNQKITVSDYRGTNAGWKLSVSRSDFTNLADSSKKIDGVTMTVSPSADVTDGIATKAPVKTIVNDQAATLINAAVNEGTFANNFDVASVDLTIAANANKNIVAGTYQAEVNWTLANTPTAAPAK